MKTKLQRGFTLLELLVVVAIIGILSAMAIINYVAALNRAKQKRTVADIRTVATAWEARASDLARYNAAGYTFPAISMPYSNLTSMLVPTYTKVLPNMDGWGRTMKFGIEGNPATEYAIRSAGRDGTFEATYVEGATTDPDCDIVYAGGTFLVYPDTIQNERR